MISASVGFQCPECVHEGSKGVRAPRTVAGGTARALACDVTDEDAVQAGVPGRRLEA